MARAVTAVVRTGHSQNHGAHARQHAYPFALEARHAVTRRGAFDGAPLAGIAQPCLRLRNVVVHSLLVAPRAEGLPPVFALTVVSIADRGLALAARRAAHARRREAVFRHAPPGDKLVSNQLFAAGHKLRLI
jgi:hypothetical protein